MQKVRTEGARVGKCNICQISGNLTRDHVPPKGSITPERVGIRSLIQTIDRVDPRIARLSQNGVKFRSLCSNCNNSKLGKELDPHLNKFSCEIAKIVRGNGRVILPTKVHIKLRPQRVVRSIIGHLLATEIRDDMTLPPVSAPAPDAMRQYFLDMSADLPTDLNIYFWPYRAKQQVILRSVGLVDMIYGRYTVIGDFIKYFPVAFWLTWQAPKIIKERMQDREIPVRGSGIDDWRTLVIRTREKDTFRPDWPEAPENSEALLINDGLCFVSEVVPNRRRR